MSNLKRTIIGLTGSIGMGKSTTAKMFSDAGIPVWDADAAVHTLYLCSEAALSAISKICPSATQSGTVDRDALKICIAENSNVLEQLENIVHPLIAADRQAFLEINSTQTVLLDIPLLFEAGLSHLVDVIVVVSAPDDTQRQRVMSRGTMTQAQFEAIVSNQMPDVEKRALADFVIETTSLEYAREQVHNILKEIEENRDA